MNGAPAVQRMAQPAAPLPVVERKPPVRREPDPPQVQRKQELESKTSTTPTPTMAKAEPETTAGPDVNELARQVLPIIKRMLVVERERRRG